MPVKRRRTATKRKYSAMAMVPAKVPRPVYLGRLQPPSGKAVLKYTQCFRGLSTVMTTNKFSLNDPTQPNTGSTGHKVRGWNQWKTLYEEYRVDRVYVQIEAINALTKPAIFAANANSTSSASITNARTALEQKSAFGGALAYQEKQVFKRSYIMAKELGDDNPYGTTKTSASPSEVLFLHTALDCMSPSENHEVNYLISLVYTVVFSSPVDPAQSG